MAKYALTLNLSNGKSITAGTFEVFDGENGRSAYAYAQDGGYTGTEEKFAVDINPNNMKSAVVSELITELQGLPVFGIVDENKKIKLTTLLPNGSYVMGYENEDGTFTKIVDFTFDGGSGEPEVTTYEVDIASVGYTDNARWSTTDGTIRAGATGVTAINKIGFNRASGQTMTITLSGITWVETSSANTAQILMFIDDSFTSGNNMPLKELPKNYSDIGVAGVLNADGTVTITITDGTKGHFNGFKICGYGSGANAKISYTIE